MLRPEQKILELLKTRGPQAAGQLSRKLKVTAMAVRQHLYRMRKQHLVDYADERRKVGRPARIWRLAAPSETRFPDNHREFTAELIAAARKTVGEDGLERILSERTRLQGDAYRRMMPRNGAVKARVAMLARIRTSQGYMAESWRDRDGSLVLAENHCPIKLAAESCGGVCEEELRLFRTILGPSVQVDRHEHLLCGARRCAYRIVERT